jgi:hypothetical protein
LLALPKALGIELRDHGGPSGRKRTDAAPAILGFRLGTLDSDPGRKAELHFMLGSRAPWVEIEDSLEQKSGGPAFGERAD